MPPDTCYPVFIPDPKVIPEEMLERKQWLLWRYEPDPDDPAAKPKKRPYTCQGYKASSTNPEHWSSFEYTRKMLLRAGFANGQGYVFTPGDPYCGLDLDDIWKSDADEGLPWGRELLARFRDTYGEASPSGTGYKTWCRAALPPGCGHEWKIGSGKVEIYDRGRYFTVTGRSNCIRVIADHQADIDVLIGMLGKAASTSGAIGGVIPHGTQHNTLVSLAGSMWRRGMSVEAIEAALQVTNARQCERPGPRENIHRIAVSAARWPR